MNLKRLAPAMLAALSLSQFTPQQAAAEPGADAARDHPAFHRIPEKDRALFDRAVELGLVTRDGLKEFLKNPNADERPVYYMPGSLEKEELFDYIRSRVSFLRVEETKVAKPGPRHGSSVTYRGIDEANLLAKLPEPPHKGHYFQLAFERAKTEQIETLRPRAASFYELGIGLREMEDDQLPEWKVDPDNLPSQLVYLMDPDLANWKILNLNDPFVRRWNDGSSSLIFNEAFNRFGTRTSFEKGERRFHYTFTSKPEEIKAPTTGQLDDLTRRAKSDKKVSSLLKGHLLNRCEARQNDPSLKPLCTKIKGASLASVLPQKLVRPGPEKISQLVSEVATACSASYLDNMICDAIGTERCTSNKDTSDKKVGGSKASVELDSPECSGKPTQKQLDQLEALITTGAITAGQLHKLIKNPAAYDPCVKNLSVSAGKAEWLKEIDRRESQLPDIEEDIPLTPFEKLAERMKLKEQYGERLETLTHYGFLDIYGDAREGHVSPPTFEKVMKSFTFEQLKTASRFEQPTLLLVPHSFLDRMRQVIDTKEFPSKESLFAYLAYIVDGAPEMKILYSDWDRWSLSWRHLDKLASRSSLYSDNIYGILGRRIQNQIASRRSDEQCISKNAYLMLKLESFRNGQPIDQKTRTIFDPHGSTDLPLWKWGKLESSYNKRRYSRYSKNKKKQGIDFVRRSPYSVDTRVRFRSAVGGNELLGERDASVRARARAMYDLEPHLLSPEEDSKFNPTSPLGWRERDQFLR